MKKLEKLYTPVKLRTLATAAIATALLVGTTGCGMITPVATQLQSNEDLTSDGQNAQVGDIAIRNAILVSNGDGKVGLSASFVNDANLVFLDITLGEQTAEFGAYDGASKTEPGDVEFTSDAQPGDLVDVYFQYGTAEGVLVSVPVLDGLLPEYAEYAPVTY